MALDFSQSWLAQPSSQKHSFEDVAGLLLRRSGDVCKMLLPAGRMAGHEYVAGDTSGSRGKSLSINTRTGVWKDFIGEGPGTITTRSSSSGLSPTSRTAAIISPSSARKTARPKQRENLGVPLCLRRSARPTR